MNIKDKLSQTKYEMKSYDINKDVNYQFFLNIGLKLNVFKT